MKAFICASVIFILLCGSIIGYEFILTKTAEEINAITSKISDAIKSEDIDAAMSETDNLTHKWQSIENLLMAFNDHKDINEMSQKLCELRSFGDYEDFREMRSRVDLFSHLFNYAIDSTKPTLSNIF